MGWKLITKMYQRMIEDLCHMQRLANYQSQR
jgi:hypothetical protein